MHAVFFCPAVSLSFHECLMDSHSMWTGLADFRPCVKNRCRMPAACGTRRIFSNMSAGILFSSACAPQCPRMAGWTHTLCGKHWVRCCFHYSPAARFCRGVKYRTSMSDLPPCLECRAWRVPAEFAVFWRVSPIKGDRPGPGESCMPCFEIPPEEIGFVISMFRLGAVGPGLFATPRGTTRSRGAWMSNSSRRRPWPPRARLLGTFCFLCLRRPVHPLSGEMSCFARRKISRPPRRLVSITSSPFRGRLPCLSVPAPPNRHPDCGGQRRRFCVWRGGAAAGGSCLSDPVRSLFPAPHPSGPWKDSSASREIHAAGSHGNRRSLPSRAARWNFGKRSAVSRRFSTIGSVISMRAALAFPFEHPPRPHPFIVPERSPATLPP